MAEKILVCSGKGGVGKSTVVSFLGRELAKQGNRVLLIDADAGLGALDVLFGVSERVMNTWQDVASESCKISDALINVGENLFLLPSPRIYPDDISGDVFRNIADECENDYDYIFIDASAGIDTNLRLTARACERCLFIATADEISVKCASAAAYEVEKYGIDREDMRIIINRFVKKAALKSRLLNVDGVIDKSGIMLLGILPEDKKIPYMSVTAALPEAKSSFMKAVVRITERIAGKNIPLMLRLLK